MIEIKKIYIEENEIDLTVEFFLNSKSRKKGSELLEIILESIISNYFSRDVDIESEWIYNVTKKLELDGKVRCFLFSYKIKDKKNGTLSIGAIY